MTEPVMVGGAPVEAGNKRAFILLGVAAAIVVMVLVLPKLLFGGGDEAADELDFPVVPAGDLTGEPVEDEAALAPVGETFSAKDPFEPLIDAATGASAPTTDDGGIAPVPVDVEAAPVAPSYEAPAYVPSVFTPAGPAPTSPAPSASSPAVAPSAESDSAEPAPAPTPAPAPAPSPAPTTIPAAVAPAGTERLALFEVLVNESGRTVAHIRLNGVRLEVAEGDAFGAGFRVVTLSLADGCGEFLYGTTSFRQCEGVERLR